MDVVLLFNDLKTVTFVQAPRPFLVPKIKSASRLHSRASLGASMSTNSFRRLKQVRVQSRSAIRLFCWASLLAITNLPLGFGQSTNVAAHPYLGWSSFSSQTQSSGFLNQTNIEAQSDALNSSVLQEHGFTYINIDDGWQKGYDTSGRTTPNASLFPDISSLINHIHQNG